MKVVDFITHSARNWDGEHVIGNNKGPSAGRSCSRWVCDGVRELDSVAGARPRGDSQRPSGTALREGGRDDGRRGRKGSRLVSLDECCDLATATFPVIRGRHKRPVIELEWVGQDGVVITWDRRRCRTSYDIE